MDQNKRVAGGGRARAMSARAATMVVGTVIAFGMASCAQNAQPAGPTGGHTASSTPSSTPSSKVTPTNGAAPTAKASKVQPHGNIKQHAKTHKINYRRHVPLTGSAKFDTGVSVSVTTVRSITSKAIGPGQVGGPALALTVKIKNDSNSSLDLSTVTVTLSGAKGEPGVLATGAPYAPLDGSLATGHSAKGTYVFTIAKADRKPITVQVQYGDGQTVLQFSGNA